MTILSGKFGGNDKKDAYPEVSKPVREALDRMLVYTATPADCKLVIASGEVKLLDSPSQLLFFRAKELGGDTSLAVWLLNQTSEKLTEERHALPVNDSDVQKRYWRLLEDVYKFRKSFEKPLSDDSPAVSSSSLVLAN